jgi:hypothetical protein
MTDGFARSRSNDDAMKALLERLEALFVRRGDGKMETSAGDLRALVSEDPERSVAVCRVYVEMAKAQTGTWRGFAQAALMIAGAYEVELHDDTLTDYVRDQFDRAGLAVPAPTVAGKVQAPAPPIEIDVTADMLAARDIYPFVVLFSHRTAAGSADRLAELRAARGRLQFTFGVPLSDPRAVWEVPEVRQYVARLHESLPYLPYYFDPDPDRRLVGIWVSCLAPAESLHDGGLDLDNPTVIAQVAVAARSVRLFAELLDEDGRERSRAVLTSALPAEYVDYVLKLDERFEAEADR